jgi:hypothetical protein
MDPSAPSLTSFNNNHFHNKDGSNYLETHFNCEYDCKNVIEDIKDLSFERPRWNVWPFHGQGDAVAGNEDEDDEVEPGFAR